MVMEAGSPGIADLLGRIDGVIALFKDVPVLRSKCQMLAELMEGTLVPFLKEMKTSQGRTSDMTHFTADLMCALSGAEKALEKVSRASAFKRMFLQNQLAEELSMATTDILSWINQLPLAQFRSSSEKEEEIKKLKLKVEQLTDELRDTGPNQEANVFPDEVMEVLRSRNNGEARNSAEGGKALDIVVQWLARKFDSDEGTILREWQEIKDEAKQLRDQVEYTAENKRRMEEDFMRQIMVYLDRGIEQDQTSGSDVSATSSGSERTPPEEFLCRVCMEVMVDPVMCKSGHTFCRGCIEKWFTTTREEQRKETCPITAIQVPPEILVDNVALRSLIRRWEEGALSIKEHPQNVEKSIAASGRIPFKVPQEPITPAPNNTRTLSRGPGSRSFSSMPARTHPVDALLSSLTSSSSVEIKSKLKELASIAQHSSGKWEICSADGALRTIAMLLDSDNDSVVEKAAGVFEAITFFMKGESCDHLPYQKREVILTSVSDCALDALVKRMGVGSQNTRLTAARTVVNLLADDETRGEVRRRDGVVKGLFRLAHNISSGVIFPSEGRSLCMRGLALLGGEKSSFPVSSDTDQALIAALIRLAASFTATPELVEETLVALGSVVDMAEPGVRSTLLERDHLMFLIRLFRSGRSTSQRRGHSSSQSSVLTEKGKKEVLNILDDISRAEGSPAILIECALITYLLPRITDDEAGVDFVTQGVEVLWRCISSAREQYSPVFFQLDFQGEMKGVVNILARDQIPPDAKLNMLSTLIYLCKGRDVDPFRESFINTGGVHALAVLVESRLVAIREEAAVMVRILAEFHPYRKELRTSEAAMLFMNLLADGSSNCRCQAVTATAALIKVDDLDLSAEVVPFKQLVDMLQPTCSSECREAATVILANAFQKHSGTARIPDVNVLMQETTIKHLLDVVRNVGGDASIKAAELLISLVMHNHTICSFFLGERGGLFDLTKFGDQHGGHLREKVVQLLDVFAFESEDTKQCVVEVDGVALLMDAIVSGRNRAVASIALKSLLDYGPAREAAVEGGLAEKAIGCMSVRALSRELIEFINLILDKKTTAERIKEARGVQALVKVLAHSADVQEKMLAAGVIAKLIDLDSGVQPILREVNGIKVLNDLVITQASEPGTLSVSGLEALKALSAATEDEDNLRLLLKEHCIEPLLSMLSKEPLSSEVEGLALNLLWKLSRGALTTGSSVDFKVKTLSKKVLRVVRTASADKLVETAARIIRNISLFSPADRAIMLNEGEGVVQVLLDRIKTCDDDVPRNDVNYSVIALERFMLDSGGRTTFINSGGIPLLVTFLKTKALDQAKCFAVRILVMVASEHKDACTSIWQCKSGLLVSLKDILELGPRDCKIQAAMLLKFLILNGPKADVCKSIIDTGCIYNLMEMRADPDCAPSATEAVETVNRYKDRIGFFSRRFAH